MFGFSFYFARRNDLISFLYCYWKIFTEVNTSGCPGFMSVGIVITQVL